MLLSIFTLSEVEGLTYDFIRYTIIYDEINYKQAVRKVYSASKDFVKSQLLGACRSGESTLIVLKGGQHWHGQVTYTGGDEFSLFLSADKREVSFKIKDVANASYSVGLLHGYKAGWKPTPP